LIGAALDLHVEAGTIDALARLFEEEERWADLRDVLRRQADTAAEDALRRGGPIELEPMGSNERRVVHEHLRDRTEIETYSEGDEPHRCVVVAPLVSE
jgi:predicted RNA-binding protein Jag